MFVASQNYRGANGMVYQGQEVTDPSPAHIARGLVYETKTVAPETPHADEKPATNARKPRNSGK